MMANEIKHGGYMVDPATGKCSGQAITTDFYHNMQHGKSGPVVHAAILYTSTEWLALARSRVMQQRVLEYCTRLGITKPSLQKRVQGACHVLLRAKKHGSGWNSTIIMACYAAWRECTYMTWARFRNITARAGLHAPNARDYNRGSSVISTISLLGRFFGKAPDWHARAIQMYKNGKTTGEISRALNVDQGSVCNYLVRAGVKKRGMPRGAREKAAPEPREPKIDHRGWFTCLRCNQRVGNRHKRAHLEACSLAKQRGRFICPHCNQRVGNRCKRKHIVACSVLK